MEPSERHSDSRRIDLPPYPRGWFAVAISDELERGAVRPIRYFDRELVLFRSTEGEARLFDAYCPHLGAHLGHGGQVEGDDLVCPFHGWRFGSDGACTGMPYGQRIPAAAKAKTWAVREQNGVILAWHSENAEAPDWAMPVFGDSNWTPCISKTWTISGHTQEVCENTADTGHFRFVHGTHIMKPTSAPKLDGPFFSLAFESDPEALVPELRLDHPPIAGTGYCFGPGLTAADIVPKGSGLVAMQRLYVTPIDDERIELRGVVNTGKLDSDEATDAFARGLSEAVFEQWEHDIPIWEHKLYRGQPALNETEPAIAVFRRWYAQFYT
jgi:nitrite reductase/ring-hydroxylating ferredoxin subunit